MVTIKDNANGKIDVIYNFMGSLEAKVLTLPKKEFLKACSEYADNVAEEHLTKK
jgi:hypothetical protein